MSEETRFIGGMFVTEAEVEEAVADMYDKHGSAMLMWSDRERSEEMAKYWVSKGKQKFEIS